MDVAALVKPFLCPTDPPVSLSEALELGLLGSQVRVFQLCGRGSALTSSWDDVWMPGGVATLPTSAAVVSVSSSASQDSSAGAGARTLEIVGWDGSWDLVSEAVTLSGATAVTTSTSFFRILSATVATAGPNGVNSGTITATIGGNTQAHIEPGDNASLHPQFTIPSGHLGLVYGWRASASADGASGDGGVRFYVTPPSRVAYPRVERRFSAGFELTRSGPLLVAEALTDLTVRMRGITSVDDLWVTTSYTVALFPSA